MLKILIVLSRSLSLSLSHTHTHCIDALSIKSVMNFAHYYCLATLSTSNCECINAKLSLLHALRYRSTNFRPSSLGKRKWSIGAVAVLLRRPLPIKVVEAKKGLASSAQTICTRDRAARAVYMYWPLLTLRMFIMSTNSAMHARRRGLGTRLANTVHGQATCEYGGLHYHACTRVLRLLFIKIQVEYMYV